uniref:Uncharacterized protein n=1 Tax=Clytia hemisphaerica TaxID=252671 RepID=A0A7M5UTX5_9CNID
VLYNGRILHKEVTAFAKPFLQGEVEETGKGSRYNMRNMSCSKSSVIIFAFLLIQCCALHFNDEVAQSYCSSRAETPSWVFAVRRHCGGEAPTCKELCQNVKTEALVSIGNQRENFACFDAIKTRKNRGSLTSIKTYTFGYGKERGCNWPINDCGPNYCCCKAF